MSSRIVIDYHPFRTAKTSSIYIPDTAVVLITDHLMKLFSARKKANVRSLLSTISKLLACSEESEKFPQHTRPSKLDTGVGGYIHPRLIYTI